MLHHSKIIVEIIVVAERVVAAEGFFIISHVKNKESMKQPFRICLPVKLADGRISIKNEEISSYPVYNIVTLGQMAGKTEPFPWRQVEYGTCRENLRKSATATEKICCYFE